MEVGYRAQVQGSKAPVPWDSDHLLPYLYITSFSCACVDLTCNLVEMHFQSFCELLSCTNLDASVVSQQEQNPG